jgi:hypothetical protein
LIHRSLDVAFQHLRWLLIALLLIPIGVAAVSSALDRSQVVSAKIWADKPTYTPKFTSDRFDSFQTPAQVEATLLQEMIATDSFDSSVLAKTNPDYGGWSQSHQQQAASDLRQSFTIPSQGEHLFVISYRTTRVDRGITMLKAIIDVFSAAVTDLEAGQVGTAQAVLQGQLDSAKQDMNSAVAAAQAYKSAHGLSESAAQTDAAYAQLQGQAQTKSDLYLSVLAQVGDAQSSRNAVANIQASVFHVVDPPAHTPETISTSTPAVKYSLGALAAVAVLEALLVYVLARRDPSVRSLEDVRREVGLKPLGSTPVVSTR